MEHGAGAGDSARDDRVVGSSSLTRDPKLKAAGNPASPHHLTHFASELPVAGVAERNNEMRGNYPIAGSPLPSSIRANAQGSHSHQRSASFSTGVNPPLTPPKTPAIDMRTRLSHRISTPSSVLDERRTTPLDNMARLQRMDLVKARNGSVLSRGLILKTDFYPTGTVS